MCYLKNDWWGRSSVGRAPQWHCGGQGFKSPRLHQLFIRRPSWKSIPQSYVFPYVVTRSLLLRPSSCFYFVLIVVEPKAFAYLLWVQCDSAMPPIPVGGEKPTSCLPVPKRLRV